MSETSRRNLLAVAGAGVAAGTVVITAGAASARTAPSARAVKEPVVAYIENPSSGVLRLMFGDSEVIVDDADLVARILNAAGGN